ncbi:sensor histidine kinase [Paenibacillus agricola]|uniref:histidine kinase n=1 Tax=Paenibacillus agricola TaxID=2716264 RepID=A0ABX0JA74_9BACL|nr:HAMP domain-containing sensor histidine kinase [Paenibacillus agricola]NHN33284.1 HAMP domain-containing histidine kinase [Paenibacillus agricola]
MRWNSIALKLGLTIILLFLIVLLSLGFVIDKIFSGFINNKFLKEADELSTRYEIMMESHGDVMIGLMDMMSELSNSGIYILDKDGKIISSTGQLKENEGMLATHQNLRELSLGRSIQKELRVAPERRYLVSAKPLREGSSITGSVFILSSLDEIDRSVQRARQFIGLAGFGALLLAVGFTYIVSRKMSQPLIQMEHAARRMATGDLGARVSVVSEDEIGSLSVAINDLANELQRYRINRSEFFANISHELRTPITYLEGYAKVLSEGLYETDEEKQQYFLVLIQEASRLKHLIQDLFDLSKMEEGKVNLDLEWIDLTEVLQNAIENISLRAKEKKIEIRVEVEPNIPSLYADGLRMEQVIFNLLDNAIRYTERGSISIKLNIVDENMQLVVVDTGIGISADELPYIFERFYRVEKSRSREHGGSGLGLAIVKLLVELQGGTIDVTSKPEEGTLFLIWFSNNQLSNGYQEDIT